MVKIQVRPSPSNNELIIGEIISPAKRLRALRTGQGPNLGFLDTSTPKSRTKLDHVEYLVYEEPCVDSPFEDSIWSAVTLCFVKLPDGRLPLTTWEVLVTLVSTLGCIFLQVAFILVIKFNMLGNPYDEENVGAMLQWRALSGHAFDKHSQSTGTTLISDLCNGNLWSWESEQYEITDEYLHSTVPGYYLAGLGTFCWIAVIATKFRSICEQVLGLLHLEPAYSGEECSDLTEDNEVAIRAIRPWARWTLLLFVELPRLAIMTCLLLVGIVFICNTADLHDLVLNCLALQFVSELDQLFFSTFLTRRVQKLVSNTVPLSVGRYFKLPGNVLFIDLVRFGFILFFMLFAMYQYLFPFLDSLKSGNLALCGGNYDFSWQHENLKQFVTIMDHNTEDTSCDLHQRETYMRKTYNYTDPSEKSAHRRRRVKYASRSQDEALELRLVSSLAYAFADLDANLVPAALKASLATNAVSAGMGVNGTPPECSRWRPQLGRDTCNSNLDSPGGSSVCRWTYEAYLCEGSPHSPTDFVTPQPEANIVKLHACSPFPRSPMSCEYWEDNGMMNPFGPCANMEIMSSLEFEFLASNYDNLADWMKEVWQGQGTVQEPLENTVRKGVAASLSLQPEFVEIVNATAESASRRLATGLGSIIVATNVSVKLAYPLSVFPTDSGASDANSWLQLIKTKLAAMARESARRAALRQAVALEMTKSGYSQLAANLSVDVGLPIQRVDVAAQQAFEQREAAEAAAGAAAEATSQSIFASRDNDFNLPTSKPSSTTSATISVLVTNSSASKGGDVGDTAGARNSNAASTTSAATAMLGGNSNSGSSGGASGTGGAQNSKAVSSTSVLGDRSRNESNASNRESSDMANPQIRQPASTTSAATSGLGNSTRNGSTASNGEIGDAGSPQSSESVATTSAAGSVIGDGNRNGSAASKPVSTTLAAGSVPADSTYNTSNASNGEVGDTAGGKTNDSSSSRENSTSVQENSGNRSDKSFSNVSSNASTKNDTPSSSKTIMVNTSTPKRTTTTSAPTVIIKVSHTFTSGTITTSPTLTSTITTSPTLTSATMTTSPTLTSATITTSPTLTSTITTSPTLTSATVTSTVTTSATITSNSLTLTTTLTATNTATLTATALTSTNSITFTKTESTTFTSSTTATQGLSVPGGSGGDTDSGLPPPGLGRRLAGLRSALGRLHDGHNRGPSIGDPAEGGCKHLEDKVQSLEKEVADLRKLMLQYMQQQHQV